MTAKEYLQGKYEWHKKHWNEHEHVDDEFTASEMEEYHQAKLKLLGMPIVSQRSELLVFAKEMQNIGFNEMDDAEKVVDIYIEANCG